MAEFVVEYGKTGRPPEADGRLDAPAFHRNHEPIWSVLGPFLGGRRGDVLEAASGTGQHVVTYAKRTPDLVWWPSDYQESHLRSIEAWRRHTGLANVRPPFRLDLADASWSRPPEFPAPGALLAIVAANVLHIAPWRVAEGLIATAARELRRDGKLFVYGAFKRAGMHTAPSNERFDASLRAENAEWGVRDTGDLAELARRHRMHLDEMLEMPANNLVLIFARDG